MMDAGPVGMVPDAADPIAPDPITADPIMAGLAEWL
jgi:hypothetical protein